MPLARFKSESSNGEQVGFHIEDRRRAGGDGFGKFRCVVGGGEVIDGYSFGLVRFVLVTGATTF